MSFSSWLVGVAALCAVLGTASAATSLEPRVRGGKTTLKVAGDARKYHLVEPGSAASLTLKGPGSLALRLRAVQPADGSGAVGTLHVSVDGTDVATFPTAASPGGRFAGRRDLVPGQAVDRELRIGEGQRVVVLSAENGPVAVFADWELEANSLLQATPLTAAPLSASPLVADKPDALAPVALAPEPEAQRPPLLQPAPVRPEPMIPITVDASTPRRSTWPYFALASALAVGFGGGVVWAIAANTDSSYNGTPEGPGRNAKLSTANDELHASMILAGLAVALAATGTVGLIFQ